MLINLPQAYERLNQKIENVFNSKHGVLKLALMLFLCFSLLYFPEIIIKRFTHIWSDQDIAVQTFVNEKIQHPLEPFIKLEAWNHFRKRDLRMTPYIIGKVFHLEAIKLFYIQAIILFPLFILLNLKTIYQLSKDAVIAVWGTIALLFTYTGNSFHYDTYFYDSYAYIGLLAAFYFRGHWSMIPILLATYFVDERSVVPSTLIFIADNLSRNSNENLKSIGSQLAEATWRNSTFLKITLVIFMYCVLRFLLFLQYNLNTPIGTDSGIHFFVVLKHKFKVPLAMFSANKLNILFIYLAASQLVKSKKWILAISYIIIFTIIFLVSTAVEDVTRSLAFGFPLILIYFQLVAKHDHEKQNNRLLIAAIAIINMLLPTYTLLLHLYQVDAFGWIQLF